MTRNLDLRRILIVVESAEGWVGSRRSGWNPSVVVDEDGREQ